MKCKVVIFILIFILFISATSISFAESESYKIDAKEFFPAYKTNLSKEKNIAGKVLGLIRNITVIASVVIISIFGLKFMYGSMEQRAEYKKSFMPLIVGLLIVGSASTIMGWVWNTGDETRGACTHNWEYQADGGMSSHYYCTRCSATVPGSSIGDECNGGKHDFKVSYYGEHNDIKLTCTRCGLERKSN